MTIDLLWEAIVMGLGVGLVVGITLLMCHFLEYLSKYYDFFGD